MQAIDLGVPVRILVKAILLVCLTLSTTAWASLRPVNTEAQFDALYPDIDTYLRNARPAVRIIVMRHGESQGNKEGIAAGQSYPVFLTKKGKKQAQQAAEYLIENVPSFNPYIHSSPSFRALQTGLEVAETWNAHKPKLLEIDTDAHLLERRYGHLEGMPRDQLERYVSKMAKEFPRLTYEEKLNYKPISSMETIHDTFQRVYPYLTSLAQSVQKPQNLLVVSHGQVLKALFFELTAKQLDIEADSFAMPNCAMLLFEWNGTDLLLKATWNVEYSTKPLLSWG
jgi:broad specificity phosphatase PhoE